MIRFVDLNNLTPFDPIGKAKEFQDRIISENVEFNKLWKNVDRTERASFIFKTDLMGLLKWEELLNITDVSKLSFEERVKQVYIEWNKRVIWTERSLEGYLDDLLGRDKYYFKLYYDEYGFYINVYVSKKFNLIKLYDNLREIIPANLTIKIEITEFNRILLKDKTNTYITKLYKCNEVPSGRIYSEAYRGKKFVDVVNVKNDSSVKVNRTYKTNEIKSGGVANK